MADDDRPLGDQLAVTFAVHREGCHARVDLSGHDRLGQQIATGRRASDAIGPACGDPEIAAVRVRPQQWSKIFAGMDVPCPLAQDPQIRETRHRFDQVAGIMGHHRQVRCDRQPGRVPRDLTPADDLSARRLMHVDRTVKHCHRGVEDWAGWLQCTGLYSPRIPLEFDGGERRNARTMSACSDDDAVRGDTDVPEPEADGTIAPTMKIGYNEP